MASEIKPTTIFRHAHGVYPPLAMLAGMQLDVFTALAEGPARAEVVAGRLGLAPDRLARLLYALVVAGLLRENGATFANTEEADEFLVRGRPRYLGGLFETLGVFWRADFLTATSIRTGEPAAPHDFTTLPDEEARAFLRGLEASAAAAGRDLARRFDFSSYRNVIDIGGGAGGLLAALCEQYPRMHGTILELPRIAELVTPMLREAGRTQRIRIVPGDIIAAPPDDLYDAAVLRALIQLLSAEDAARAICHAAAALAPGGAIYIIGAGILDDSRLAPRSAVFRSLTFMNLFRGGASYTEAEHFAWLAAAGCINPERIHLPSGASIIRAIRAG